MAEAHVRDDLGLYALGLLEPAEHAAVERHLDRCAECRAALAAEEETAWRLAEATAREARPALADAIVARHRSRAPLLRWQLAFAAAVLIALGATGALLGARAEVAQEQRLREDYARALGAVAEGRVFPLQAQGGIQGSAALVVTREGDPYLVLALPAPPPGKAYEAWIIRGNTPNRAGLAPAGQGTATLRLDVTVRPGDVAAITLEDAAGVDRPTSAPLLLVGVGGL